MKKGFTLIEMMVVVVIIAILAGLALPLYTKSVERSRISEAVKILGVIRDAEINYALEYGNYSNGGDLGVLDITINPVGKYFNFNTLGNSQGIGPFSSNDGPIANATRNSLDVFYKGGYEILINKTGGAWSNSPQINKLF